MASCNSVYKGMETPDDVYLASGRTVEKAVVRYESEYDNDVRYTRMRCRSIRYRFFNEYDCNYSPYIYGNSNYYSSTPIRSTNLNSYHTNNINVIKTKSLNTFRPYLVKPQKELAKEVKDTKLKKNDTIKRLTE
tara:strand:- start:66 stop:467 length:402 start_codon:yes stop_codon:yes gene_type:complete